MATRDTATDNQLIAAASQGDRDAFGELVVRYQNRLFNAVSRLLQDETMAADVVQEAFLLAWKKLGQFDRRSKFYTWLFCIARNRSVSLLRRKRPEQSGYDHEGQPLEPRDDRAAAPDQALLDAENKMLLERALAALREEHRAILVLREFEQLDYSEIAKALEIPVGTVRSRLFRARMELRDEFQRLSEGKMGERNTTVPSATGS